MPNVCTNDKWFGQRLTLCEQQKGLTKCYGPQFACKKNL